MGCLSVMADGAASQSQNASLSAIKLVESTQGEAIERPQTDTKGALRLDCAAGVVEQRDDNESPKSTLSSMKNLAKVLQEEGRWQEAEQKYREVLEKMGRLLGKDHSDTLDSMDNLAMVLQDQGKWQEAEQMHRQVLETRRLMLRQNYATILSSMNNLAKVLCLQGKRQEDDDMYRESLAAINEQHNPRRQMPDQMPEKFSAGCQCPDDTLNMSFIIRDATFLRQMELVKNFPWQADVEKFIDDADATWIALAPVTNCNSSTVRVEEPGPDSLGVVVVKSSHGFVMPVNISIGIWLQKGDRGLIRRIISQVVLQVFGANPKPGNHDIRRNRFTVAGIDKTTRMEVQIACYALDAGLQSFLPVQPGQDEIDLAVALGEDGLNLLQQAFSSCSLRLTGEEEDFLDFAELAAQRLKRLKRSQLQRLAKDTRPSGDKESLLHSAPKSVQSVENAVALRGTTATSSTTFNGIANQTKASCSAFGRLDAHALEFRPGMEVCPNILRNGKCSAKKPHLGRCQYFLQGTCSRGASCKFCHCQAEVPEEKVKGNVPNPVMREKLLAGCTDNISFLIRDPQELAGLELVKESGFQEEILRFLDVPASVWSALAAVRMAAYHSGEDYSVCQDSNILGVVVVKSVEALITRLQVSVGIWLQKQDPHVLQRVVSQVVLQVFGANPMHRSHDVRRNHFTLQEVAETTPMETEITFFTPSKGQPVVDPVDLQMNLREDGLASLSKQSFENIRSLKLTGQEQDFVDLAERLVKRFKKRPEVPKCLKLAKDFEGLWIPGTLFKCTTSDQLRTLDGRDELDGRVVVLLPSQDCHGSLLKESQQELVAVVDTVKQPIYVVPRIALHPLDRVWEQQVAEYLRDKYNHEVKVRSKSCLQSAAAKISLSPVASNLEVKETVGATEETWEDGSLCMGVVGGHTCMVRDTKGSMKLVKPCDLRLATSFDKHHLPGEDAVTLTPVLHA